MSLDQWSQTPASNDLANYFQTGMAPSKVKNAGWDVMADAAAVIAAGSMPTSGGTANAQTVTNTRAYGALFTGMWAVFVPSATNTGAMTLQVDGLTAKNVFANGAAAIAGQVISGIPAWCRYDGTQWQLLNPQRSTGSFTITLTGMTATITGTVNYAIGTDGKSIDAWIAANITGTSNTTAMTGTGIPAALTTTTQKILPLRYQDNGSGSTTLGSIHTGTSTTWTFSTNVGPSGAWTGSAGKGLLAENFAWHFTTD